MTVNKFGQEIKFDDKMMSKEWDGTRELLTQLSAEYNTRLFSVSPGASQAAGTVDMGGNMRLSSRDKSTVIHEFAHSITIEQLTKYGVEDHSEFWREIRKIRTRYRKAAGSDSRKWISSYAHSSRSIDEFYAESFAHAKMREMGLDIPNKYGKDFTFSQQVLDVTNKYFRKSVAKDSGSGIIKEKRNIHEMNLQFFAEKDIKNQSSSSLKRAIRKYQARIEEHEIKINNPSEIYPDWDNFDERYQQGLKRHWNKEIRNFKQSIQDRIDELKERGDYDE